MKLLHKNIAIFGIAILLSAGVFCMINGAVSASHQNMDGDMSIFCASQSGNPLLCVINGFHYASLMETISHTVPQKIGEYLSVLAFALLLFVFGKQFTPHLQRFKEESSCLYMKFPEIFSIVSPLRLVFARGILHPQIYNYAYIS
jgi:hypothetical protein